MLKKADTNDFPATAPGRKPTARPTDIIRQQEPTPIGPSMHINGHIRGRQDLVVHGHVEGSIDIGDGLLTVTSEGRVDADVSARIINIEGRVEGALQASEQINVRRNASVRGSIKAPRIALDFGCSFSGSIDTEQAHDARSAERDDKIADFKSAIATSGATSGATGGGGSGAASAVSKASPR